MTIPVNFIAVDRYWFLTWTTYGTWLPGDGRGFVGEAFNETRNRVNQNQFGKPAASPIPQWEQTAKSGLKSPPVIFCVAQAEALFEQIQETAQFRGWLPIAVAIMPTHLHAVVGVPGDPNPDKVLGDFKAYGSRRLSQQWKKPGSGTWWTTGGSKRKLPDEHSVEAAIAYIRQQPNALLLWTREEGKFV